MTPEERVRRFCDAMAGWERTRYQQLTTGLDSPELRDLAFNQLRAIFDEHLTEKAKAPPARPGAACRFGARLGGGPRLGGACSFSDPPWYDQKVERAVPSRKSTTYVFTRHRCEAGVFFGLTHWRFTVVIDHAGTPLIDDVRGRSPAGDWKRCPY